MNTLTHGLFVGALVALSAADASAALSQHRQERLKFEARQNGSISPDLRRIEQSTNAAVSTKSLAVGSGTNVGGPDWVRPFADGSCCSGLGPVKYHVANFRLSQADTCDFSSVQSGWDGYLFIYREVFDPLAQSTNFVAGDDDGVGGIGTSNIDNVALLGNTVYWVVTTGFANGDEGDFTTTIDCPVAAVTFPIPTTPPAPPANNRPTGTLSVVGTLLEGEVVTTDDDIDDEDGLGEFEYRWFLDGIAVAGATAASFALDDLAVGKMVEAEVQYNDDRGARERVRSAAVGPVRPAGTTLGYQKRVFFFNPADNATQESLLRLSNPNASAADVEILGFDDTGMAGGDVSLSVPAGASIQIRAVELEQGSSEKGITGGLGAGTGKWQLKVNSSEPLAVMSLVRVPGDDLANMGATAPLLSTGAHTVLHVQGDPSASDETVLRLVNRTALDNAISITARDATGVLAPGGEITAVLAPYQAINLNTDDLIAGNADKGVSGALGMAAEVHSIEVRAEQNLAVQGLLRSASGVLHNVSAVAPRLSNDDDSDRFLATVNPAGGTPASTVRVVSLNMADDILLLGGIDDAGVRPPSGQYLLIDANGRVELDANDLEEGNPDKGLYASTAPFGDGEGRWQVTVSTGTDGAHAEVQSLAATPDGSRTNLSEVAPRSSRYEAAVWVFNPASNEAQRSMLRVINREEVEGSVLVEAFDDEGNAAPGGSVVLTLPANAAVDLDAQDLEQGNAEKGLSGALGDGSGKWRLQLSADVEIMVQSLVESQSGGLTNISQPVQ